jgi:Flp pilus assembly protein TadG
MEPNPRRLKHRQRGSEVVEFGLILLPLLGFTFLIIDLGWAIFARATIQNAVREGVRYAVTSQTLDSRTGHVASIQSVVRTYSMGFLSDLKYVTVKFYRPDTFVELTGTGANDGGNLVEISIENLPVSPLLPLFRSPAPLQMTARSSDRMEASPTTGAPPL